MRFASTSAPSTSASSARRIRSTARSSKRARSRFLARAKSFTGTAAAVLTRGPPRARGHSWRAPPRSPALRIKVSSIPHLEAERADVRRAVRVAPIDHHPATEAAVEACDAERRHLGADRAQEPVGRTLHRRARDDRRDRHRTASPLEPLAHAGHGQDRADRDQRIRRADDHQLGALERVEHAGRRARGGGRRQVERGHVVGRAVAHHVLLEVRHRAVAANDPRGGAGRRSSAGARPRARTPR